MAVVKRRPIPKMSQESIERAKKALEEERRREESQKMVEHSDEFEREIIHEEEQEIIDNTETINKNYNLEMFKPALSKTTSRSNSRAGVMSIVNSNCGKRVMLSTELMDRLNSPSKISMSFSEEYIAVGIMLPNNNNQLTIKSSGKKGVIYSAGIVSEITDKYSLDFNNRTSITFSEVDYIEVNGSIIAIINAKQVKQEE